MNGVAAPRRGAGLCPVRLRRVGAISHDAAVTGRRPVPALPAERRAEVEA
jgi:hypothetical protein